MYAKISVISVILKPFIPHDSSVIIIAPAKWVLYDRWGSQPSGLKTQVSQYHIQ